MADSVLCTFLEQEVGRAVGARSGAIRNGDGKIRRGVRILPFS